jgi:hypothetical protein
MEAPVVGGGWGWRSHSSEESFLQVALHALHDCIIRKKEYDPGKLMINIRDSRKRKQFPRINREQ